MRYKILGLLFAIVVITSACMSQNNGEVMAEQPHVVKEIRIQPATTPEPTPFPDFDLENLSIVRKEGAENEEKETVYSGDVPGGADTRPDAANEAEERYRGTAGEPSDNVGETSRVGSGDSGTSGQYIEDERQSAGSGAEAEGTEPEWQYYGSCRITHYCPCSECCGEYANGYTANGEEAVAGWTVANGGLPFGTMVLIDGHEYCVTDRGVAGDEFDIFVDTHEEALQRGLYYTDVYVRYQE